MNLDNDTEIRPFSEEDIHRVAEILLYSFSSKFQALLRLPENKQLKFLIDSGFVDSVPFEGYMVAEKEGNLVGVMLLKWKDQKRTKSAQKAPFLRLVLDYGVFTTIKLLTSFSILEENISTGECYIEHIAVAPEARGLGVGSLLLDCASYYTSEKLGLSATALYVAASNSSAQKLYERKGFLVRRGRKSLLTQVFLHQYRWLYMTKHQGTESPKVKLVLKGGWWLGFLGFLGLPHIRTFFHVLKGEAPPFALLGLLWLLWFSLFIPEKRI